MGIQTVESLTVLHRPLREADAWLPESPRLVTWKNRKWLGWVNIQTAFDATTGSIHLLDVVTHDYRRIDLDDRPGFFVDLGNGTAIVGTGKRLRLMDWTTEAMTELATIDDESPFTIINDGEPTPDGEAIVFGTKDVRFQEKIAALYLFTASDRRISKLAGDMTCSNGKVLTKRSADRFTLYDIDTPRKLVERYELNLTTRSVRYEGIAIDLRNRADYPDGMCAAWEDDLAVIAFYHPGEVSEGLVELFDLKRGESFLKWLTPGSPRVTSVLMVPHPKTARQTVDLNQLFATTAVEGMPPHLRAKSPNAGCVFASEIG